MKREAINHTKMKRLCRRMDWPVWQGVGMLESLWLATAREAPAGDIGKLSNEDIALAIDYRGDETILITALVLSGWLDPDEKHRLIIHDWPDHADDSTHAKIARSRVLFADGTVPKLTKLNQHEREAAELFYAAASKLNGIPRNAEYIERNTDSIPRNSYSIPQNAESTEKNAAGIPWNADSIPKGPKSEQPCLALPCPALPFPSQPSPSSASVNESSEAVEHARGAAAGDSPPPLAQEKPKPPREGVRGFSRPGDSPLVRTLAGVPEEPPPAAAPEELSGLRASMLGYAEAAHLHWAEPDDAIVRRVYAAGGGRTAEQIHGYLVTLQRTGRKPAKSWAWFETLVADWAGAK